MNFEQAWQVIQPIRGWLGNRLQAEMMWNLALTGNVIELGSYCGKSTCLMALAMKSVSAPYFVYAIDTFRSTNEELPDEDTYDEFISNVIAHDVRDYVRPRRANTHDKSVAAEVPCDAALVYVDAGHDREAVWNDIGTWRMHVRKGGTMMFHDFYPPNGPLGDQFPGVRQAIKEARLVGYLNNIRYLPPDACYFVRSACGCGGW